MRRNRNGRIYFHALYINAVLSLLTSCQSGETEKRDKRPNVLVILTDQHTNDALSYLGNPFLKTPAMDQLAEEGTFFTASYCSSPVCGPARSSLITGRMPHETGVIWNSTNIHQEVPTIGQIFKEAGYNTAWAGKWHLPQSYPAKSEMDSVAGFEVIPFQSLSKEWDLGEDTDGPIADATVNYLNNYSEDQPFYWLFLFIIHMISAMFQEGRMSMAKPMSWKTCRPFLLITQ